MSVNLDVRNVQPNENLVELPPGLLGKNKVFYELSFKPRLKVVVKTIVGIALIAFAILATLQFSLAVSIVASVTTGLPGIFLLRSAYKQYFKDLGGRYFKYAMNWEADNQIYLKKALEYQNSQAAFHLALQADDITNDYRRDEYINLAIKWSHPKNLEFYKEVKEYFEFSNEMERSYNLEYTGRQIEVLKKAILYKRSRAAFYLALWEDRHGSTEERDKYLELAGKWNLKGQDFLCLKLFFELQTRMQQSFDLEVLKGLSYAIDAEMKYQRSDAAFYKALIHDDNREPGKRNECFDLAAFYKALIHDDNRELGKRNECFDLAVKWSHPNKLDFYKGVKELCDKIDLHWDDYKNLTLFNEYKKLCVEAHPEYDPLLYLYKFALLMSHDKSIYLNSRLLRLKALHSTEFLLYCQNRFTQLTKLEVPPNRLLEDCSKAFGRNSEVRSLFQMLKLLIEMDVLVRGATWVSAKFLKSLLLDSPDPQYFDFCSKHLLEKSKIAINWLIINLRGFGDDQEPYNKVFKKLLEAGILFSEGSKEERLKIINDDSDLKKCFFEYYRRTIGEQASLILASVLPFPPPLVAMTLGYFESDTVQEAYQQLVALKQAQK